MGALLQFQDDLPVINLAQEMPVHNQSDEQMSVEQLIKQGSR